MHACAKACERAASTIATLTAELAEARARDIPSSRLVGAHIIAMGMHAENLQREAEGKSMAYVECDFVALGMEVLDAAARKAAEETGGETDE
jgi:hypothetical protein